MKKYLLASVLFFTLLYSCEKHAKPVDVPKQVKMSFAIKYPGASNVQWENEHDKYEAEFIFDGKKIEAEFNADGGFLKEEKK